MTWARIDDGYFTHRKVVGLSKDAKLWDLAAIGYSARELRDGLLSRLDQRIVAAEVDVDLGAVLAELLPAGRGELCADGSYAIHDYLLYNPTREKVLKDREEGAQRKAKSEARHRARRNGVSNGVSNAVSPGDPVPVPVPVREPGPGPDRSADRAKNARNGAPAAPAGLIDRAEIVSKDDDAPTRAHDLTVNPDLQTYVAAREYGFHDNDATRTAQTLQRMWLNSGLDEDDFRALLERAVELTKKAQMAGQIRQRDEDGKMKGWPFCMKILEDLLREQAGKPPKAKINIPLGHRLSGMAAGLSGLTLLDYLSDGKLDHIVRMSHWAITQLAPHVPRHL